MPKQGTRQTIGQRATFINHYINTIARQHGPPEYKVDQEFENIAVETNAG